MPPGPSSTRLRVYFTMVHHPAGIMRVGKPYRERATARSWVKFVSASWRGLRVSVEACTLRVVDGRLDADSVKLLDQRYNIDGQEWCS